MAHQHDYAAWDYLARLDVQRRIAAGTAPDADDPYRREVAEQLALKARAAEKLPSLADTPFLLTGRALEQCSGDAAAAYKTGIVTGASVCDLTGGLGMDTLAFHRVGMRVTYCERNPELARIFGLNCRLNGVEGITSIAGDAIGYLATVPDGAFEWIYCDPDRRGNGRRHVALHACEPDAVAYLPLMLAKAGRVCIKASPAMEIAEAVRLLPRLEQVHAVSVDGACKEILLVCGRGGADGNPAVHVAVLGTKTIPRIWTARFSSSGPGGRTAPCNTVLCVPDAALIKSRCGDAYAAEHGLALLQRGQNLYTGADVPAEFPGKAYRVQEHWPWHRKTVGNALVKRGVTACTLHVYWHRTDQAAARKLLKITAADNNVHLFLCYGQGGEKLAVLADKYA